MLMIVETNGLCKQYGSALRVNSLGLRVPEGAVYGFLGPNGAGKSTTLKMVLGLTRPTRGTITLFGKPLTAGSRMEMLRSVGSLIESPSYYGHLTGEENLRIVQTLRGRPAREVGEVLALVRLGEARDKKVSQYSLGMKQRLGLAAALLGRPKLLLLDEPTNGLDPAGIQEMRELISDLPKHYGMTVMVSSHLLSEIDQMATDVGIIDRGKLIYQGSLRKLHEKAKGSIHIQVLNQTAAMRILEEHGESFTLENGMLVLEEREEVQVAELVALLAGHGAQVTGVSGQQKSLEDIFLTLTGKQVSL